ncbi:MAG TPA: DUF6714 family protein [Bryobacteraceae bacterium]|nr:DUF6714 family protein [Bryobacteraceae bacterium]
MENDRSSAATDLRAAITLAFPPVLFPGAVTPADEEKWAEELDEDLDLRDSLRGRSWPQVTSELIDRHAGGLALLTPEAFAAFLPAWLTRSLDQPSLENDVREFTVYTFCRFRQNEEPELTRVMDEHYSRRLRQLTAVQLAVVKEFLNWVGAQEPRDLREDVVEALAEISMQGLS